MLFIKYWELNENFTPKDVVAVGAEVIEKGLYPVEGTKVLGWYVAAGDVPNWGITIEESENVEQVLEGVAIWTVAKPGMFKVVKTSPAMTAEDAMRIATEM